MSETPTMDRAATAEQSRLQRSRDAGAPWKLWGPYLSERQWGTVREDYSENGGAWGYFSHDQARSRAYRWGEDGIAGFSDDKQRLCFALALWNGKDPILKERMFGLTNGEGNHGEDVKEYYFYIDSTPTHSYMKMLYKYPQGEFPYRDLVETNRRRGRAEAEYELIDTGVFNEDRYFDVFVEYAKETPTDILIQISVSNRGPDATSVHVLPTLWFRNVWTWWPETRKPSLRAASTKNGAAGIAASSAELGDYFLYCEGKPSLLFTEHRAPRWACRRSADYWSRSHDRRLCSARLRLDLAFERLANRSRRPGHFAEQPRMAGRVQSRPARSRRGRHRRVRLRNHSLHRQRRDWGRRGAGAVSRAARATPY